ncbi:MAG: hypothetical protein H6R01_1041 [Burkholderiaceae bacterium]|nr:hypothetical protein [Burkholderiaceae bacterium]
MTDKHTPTPWRVAEDAFDNDGMPESVIRGLDDRAAIAVTLDFGENNPSMREANARRIVACVNACAGKTDEEVRQLPEVLRGYHNALENVAQQRDELLLVMTRAAAKLESDGDEWGAADELRKAIASVKGEA